MIEALPITLNLTSKLLPGYLPICSRFGKTNRDLIGNNTFPVYTFERTSGHNQLPDISKEQIGWLNINIFPNLTTTEKEHLKYIIKLSKNLDITHLISNMTNASENFHKEIDKAGRLAASQTFDYYNSIMFYKHELFCMCFRCITRHSGTCEWCNRNACDYNNCKRCTQFQRVGI